MYWLELMQFVYGAGQHGMVVEEPARGGRAERKNLNETIALTPWVVLELSANIFMIKISGKKNSHFGIF